MAAPRDAPRAGDRVMLTGLSSKRLNGTPGTVLTTPAAPGRVVVEFIDPTSGARTRKAIKVANLLQIPLPSVKPQDILIIDPVELHASVASIRACVRPLEHSLGNDPREIAEKAVLRERLGWQNPRGLFGYSVRCMYKDLYIYFDYADTTSDVNELATYAFRMYNLDGEQCRCLNAFDWKAIRGPAVVIRVEPPRFSGPPAPPAFARKFSRHNPSLEVDEMIETLCFFRDSEFTAQKIAATRDAQRYLKLEEATGRVREGHRPAAAYVLGPTGVKRPVSKVVRDNGSCDNCGKQGAVAGGLKTCKQCKAVRYCSKACQKAAWKGGHKRVCKELSKN